MTRLRVGRLPARQNVAVSTWQKDAIHLNIALATLLMAKPGACVLEWTPWRCSAAKLHTANTVMPTRVTQFWADMTAIHSKLAREGASSITGMSLEIFGGCN